MIHFVALPLLIVAMTAAIAWSGAQRLTPPAAARGSSVVLVAVIAASAPTFWMLALSGLAHLGVRSSWNDWSMHLLPNQPAVSGAIGVAALVVSVIGAARLTLVVRTHLRVRSTEACGLQVVDTPDVFAYTLPGPARTIAISRGLCESVDEREFDIVLAHEQSHARHRHDRYLLLALIAGAVVPFMQSAPDRLRFHLERWADEDAVHATGADRRLAALTIAKVGLAGTSMPVALGISGHSVADRAEALIAPAPTANRFQQLHSLTAISVVVAVSALQLHHTLEFISHSLL